jgi:flagellar export protein FliJ
VKKFSFRLERILQYRKRYEDEKKRQLTNAVSARDLILAKQREILKSLEENEIQTSEEQSAGVALQGLYGAGLLAQLALSEQEIIEHEKRIEIIKNEYIEAIKDVKVLTTIKESRLAEYNHDLEKAEAAIIDELATQRSPRKRYTL